MVSMALDNTINKQPAKRLDLHKEGMCKMDTMRHDNEGNEMQNL